MNRLSKAKITRTGTTRTLFPYKDMLWSCPERDEYGIVLCETGKSIFTQNGVSVVSEPNTVVFLPKGASYTLYEEKGGVYYCINFDCEIPEPITDLLVMNIEHQDRYVKSFFKIQGLNAAENNELGLLKHVYEFMEMLVKEYNNKKYPLMPVISYIEKNYSDCDLTNQTLAEKSGYTEAYMRQLFKAQFGTTPKQYILDVRLQHASKMLADSNKKVTDIASDCGFANLAHFSRAFRDKFGESPIEYRTSYRGMWL